MGYFPLIVLLMFLGGGDEGDALPDDGEGPPPIPPGPGPCPQWFRHPTPQEVQQHGMNPETCIPQRCPEAMKWLTAAQGGPQPLGGCVPEEEEAQDMSDQEWLDAVDALIHDAPVAGSFYRVRSGSDGGLNAGNIARRILDGPANTGSNRLNYIKCMTRVGWNNAHYASTNYSQDYGGNLYNADGLNLSAAWLPRHAPAIQLIADRRMPPRTINAAGEYIVGQPTGYYGLLWLPEVQISGSTVACNEGSQPPGWLMGALVAPSEGAAFQPGGG